MLASPHFSSVLSFHFSVNLSVMVEVNRKPVNLSVMVDLTSSSTALMNKLY